MEYVRPRAKRAISGDTGAEKWHGYHEVKVISFPGFTETWKGKNAFIPQEAFAKVYFWSAGEVCYGTVASKAAHTWQIRASFLHEVPTSQILTDTWVEELAEEILTKITETVAKKFRWKNKTFSDAKLALATKIFSDYHNYEGRITSAGQKVTLLAYMQLCMYTRSKWIAELDAVRKHTFYNELLVTFAEFLEAA